METYALRIDGNSSIAREIKAENIDNLRKRLIEEYAYKVHYINVDKFTKGKGYVHVGKMDLHFAFIWHANRNGNLVLEKVSPKTGKLEYRYR